MNPLVKMGPWGNGYQTGNKDIYELEIAPLRLESITVHHSSVIEALGFSYRDRENRPHTAGPWGKVTPGHDTTIMLGPLEFVTEVHGMYGPYYSTFCMADLTFVTNLRTYGPFGDYGHTPGGWNSFSVPVNKSKGTIVGFFVRAPHHVSELGVYVRPF
ncbi:protein GOS9-like isoform X3 [Panicum virgatum]|uniref:Jacalin-type lectin domain-containing protein n=1 Tax=Panicum virgatum TaxID=38727 RepID=A0A8T0UBX9_PANVG|nr:protein GOS9-like isoform X3 [Panicum virgatum]KAG2621571.1 hypothetical protein PVAP13_3NG254816 [Panicum virgatum]